MPRLLAVLLLTLSVTACAMPTEPNPTNDIGRTTSENVGDTMTNSSTWSGVFSAPGRR